MEPNRLAYLFRRYFEKTCTPEEKMELMRMIGEHTNDESLRDLLDEALVSYSTDEKLSNPSADNLFRSILHEASSRQGSTPVKIKTPVHRLWYRVAAAVIVGGMLTGVWFIFNSREKGAEPKQLAVQQERVEVVPGGNKAMLTLSDGSQILLDSAGNGQLAQQSNVTILKKSDGELAYQRDGAGSAQAVIAYNTLSTPRGGQYKLTLPDGSKVWLNAASSIKYPIVFTGNERRVAVTGEAYFEVARNPQMPFRVNAKQMDVEVLGTHFNINAYSDEPNISTTLVEGSVKVGAGSQQPVIIKPGQQASLPVSDPSGASSINVHPVDIDAVIAWKNGLFHFEGTSTAEVMRQIARWYDVEVEYRGNTKKHFRGMIARNSNVTEVFSMLQMTGEIQFKIEGKKVIVMP